MTTYAAFLRGINVGGKNTVSMPELRACFESLGYTNVRTYINSGNVIFDAGTGQRSLERAIEPALEKQFNIPITVMVRSQAEVEQLLADVPRQWLDTTDYKYEFFLLHHSADSPDALKNFSPKPEVEELRYVPGALIWRIKRAAITRGRIIKMIGTPIYKQISIRTPNTIHKIADLMKRDSVHVA